MPFVYDRHDYDEFRLPFRPADDEWRAHLDWSPHGLRPHRHQAEAWMRLASRDRVPRPMFVTTATGSGETESFLVPLLDHCVRQRQCSTCCCAGLCCGGLCCGGSNGA